MFRTAATKLSAATFVALALIGSSIALAYGEESPSPESDEAALSAPPVAPEGQELEAKRTATSQTYLLPDGVHETRIFETPINYRDEEGDWQTIDEGLEPKGNAFVNGDSSFDVRLPGRVGA